MAGILDKKTRFIDYVITQEGKRQLASGKLRAEYASVTDMHTFYDKNELKNRSIKNVPHPSIIESMELFKNLDNNNKNKIYFTHLNHTNKLLQIDSFEYKKTLSKHFNILNDKMVFNI